MVDSTNNGLGSFIGAGIDLINAKGPFADQLKQRILKPNVESIVTTTPVTEGSLSIQATESLSEIYSKWEINAGGSVDTPFFSGSFKAEYSNESRHMSCNKFFKGAIHIKGYAHMLTPHTGDSRLAIVDYLTENGYVIETALRDILGNVNPQQLFKLYGTHMILGGITGGAIQLTAKYANNIVETTNDLSTTMQFACGFATGSSSGKYNETHKRVFASTDFKVVSRAGDPRELANLHSYEDIPKVFKAWSDSVAESNYVLSDITLAIPIWEFCTDGKRKDALMVAYTGATDSRFKEIENYFPTPKENEEVTMYVMYNSARRIIWPVYYDDQDYVRTNDKGSAVRISGPGGIGNA
jgi:hypothetical protein